MNKQPFYHRMEILFTATSDVADVANSEEFLQKLARFLKRNLRGGLLPETVQIDGLVDAEAGDPADLM